MQWINLPIFNLVDCTIPMVNSNISLNYSSTLEDSLLIFQCEEGLFPCGVFIARCHRNGTWIPNPSNHKCTTSSAGKSINNHFYKFGVFWQIIVASLSADCGDPNLFPDGYVKPYTSTLEGARVNRVYVCHNGNKSSEEIACSSQGHWEIVNGSKYSTPNPGTTL